MVVVTSGVLMSLGALAVCDASLAAVLSDEIDADKVDSSVMLLPRWDSVRSALVATFCCDLEGEDSMLVTDEDLLA